MAAPCHPVSSGARGPRLAGERRRAGLRRGYQEKEENAGSMRLTTTTRGRVAVAGDEDEGGGACGSEAAEELRWSSGRGRARTRSASLRRCGRRGRQRRDGLDGAGDEEEGRSAGILQSRNTAKRRGGRSGGWWRWDEENEGRTMPPFIGAEEHRARRSGAWRRRRPIQKSDDCAH